MKFIEGLRRLGLDQKLDLEIPGSAEPRIPYPGCSFYGWTAGSLPWMSIGYVVTIPPIYTLAIYNAIANNGKLIRPFFVKGFSRNGEVLQQFTTSTLKEKICSDQTLIQIRLMLDSVIGSGTGAVIHTDVVSIAGKTGTAQLNYGSSAKLSHQVSFCGYFPAEQPKYSAIVVIRDPKGEYASGGKMAGGVFREVAERIYSRSLRLTPGQKRPSAGLRDTLKGGFLNLKHPIVKNGNNAALMQVLKAINVPFSNTSNGQSKWVENNSTEDGIRLKPFELNPHIMPDLTSMGARDAAYMLGNMGLEVLLTGKGSVVGQSIKPGTIIHKGQSVQINLEL